MTVAWVQSQSLCAKLSADKEAPELDRIAVCPGTSSMLDMAVRPERGGSVGRQGHVVSAEGPTQTRPRMTQDFQKEDAPRGL